MDSVKQHLHKRASAAIGKYGFAGFFAIPSSLPFLTIANKFDGLLSTLPSYSARVRREASRLLDEAAQNPALKGMHLKDGPYKAYLLQQITKSIRMSSKFSLEKKLSLFLHKYVYPERVVTVRVFDIAHVASLNLPVGSDQPRVLSIGCRDELEIVVLRKIFKTPKVVGLDIFSLSKDIQSGDMHCLPFPNEHFDCVVACHSLEHCYDPCVALREFTRVLVQGGILAVEVPVQGLSADGPVPFPPESTDRWDFCNISSLLKIIRATTYREPAVVHAVDVENKPGNIQLVVRIGTK